MPPARRTALSPQMLERRDVPAPLVSEIFPADVNGIFLNTERDPDQFALTSTVSNPMEGEVVIGGTNFTLSSEPTVGYLEVDLGVGGRAPGPDDRIELVLPDSGSKGTDSLLDTSIPPTDNRIAASVYAGDGRVTLEDREASDTFLANLTTKGDFAVVEPYTLDVTDVVRRFREMGQRYLGVRFRPLTATVFESFGDGDTAFLRATQDPRGILRDSVTPRIGRVNPLLGFAVDPTGPTFAPVFAPRGAFGPVRFAALATALEVDHFDWVQQVTRLPEGTTLFAERDRMLTPVPLPLQDRNAGDGDADVLTLRSNRRGFESPIRQRAAGVGGPFYYTESQRQFATVEMTTETAFETAFEFEDTPNVAAPLYEEGGFLAFELRLVGVKTPTGTAFDNYDGLGVNIRWQSNAVNANGTVVSGGPSVDSFFAEEGELDALILGGGVYAVRTDTDPLWDAPPEQFPQPTVPALPPLLPPPPPPSPPPPPTPPPPPPTPPADVARLGVPQFAIGSGADTTVSVFDPDGSVRLTAPAFDPSVAGGVRVAVTDFDRDGVPDTVAGTGPGGPTRVRVFSGATNLVLFDLAPFEAAFTGGVYVAVGDLTGDGVPDLVITPDEGGGPRVDVYSGNEFGKSASFFGIDDPNFRGGARASTGDINGDGRSDLIVVAGFGGGPRVAGFDGTSIGGVPRKVFADFFAFEQTLRNGVFVTAGDLDGDGFAELIAGGGPGGGPRVTAFSGKSLLANQLAVRADYFAGDASSRGGVRVAVKNLDGDNRADLVVGSGTGAGSRVTGYLGRLVGPAGTPAAAFDFDAFPGSLGGVFVG